MTRTEAMTRVIEAARKMPRTTPAPGGANTVHTFEIPAWIIWEFANALADYDNSTPDSGGGWQRDRPGWYWIRMIPGGPWRPCEWYLARDGEEMWAGTRLDSEPVEIGPYITAPPAQEPTP